MTASKNGNRSRFVATIERVVVHYTVKISPRLLAWMDSGHGRAAGVFKRLYDVDDIEEDSIEYNGHFGPYLYFACEQDKAPTVTKAVLKIAADCDRAMQKAHIKQASLGTRY